jgi:3-oxoacyl-[acyl-carrier protein] reductase
MAQLAGKQCVVTGDGRGIAPALAREGADVAVIDRLADNPERVAAGINRLGVRALIWRGRCR